MKPRVLQVITRFGLGGAERVALSIVAGLRSEIDFGVFAVHGREESDLGHSMQSELANAGVPCFRGTAISMKKGGMIPGGVALARTIRDFHPDVVHYHSETPEACGATAHAMYSVARTSRIVRTIHNSEYWRYWPRIGRWVEGRLANAHIVCVSMAAQDEFLRHRKAAGIAISREPLVIYNGVSLKQRSPLAGPRHTGVRHVLFAGRFEEQKGVDILARALPLVKLEAGVRVELTFMGHGRYETLLHRLATNSPPGWSVTLRGPVANLDAVFAEYDLVAAPSRFEGLGLVAIEATLCGLPVVATTAQGLREALPHDHPWLAEPEDVPGYAARLSEALAAPERWAPAVGLAQRFAQERFSPARMAEAYHRLYREAISGSA